MPSIRIRETDSSKFADQTLIALSYNGDRNDYPIISASGVGKNYKSITYNDDNTITLVDEKDIEHVMICKYNDEGKLIEVTYDDVPAEITYSDEEMVAIVNTAIDLSLAPTSN